MLTRRTLLQLIPSLSFIGLVTKPNSVLAWAELPVKEELTSFNTTYGYAYPIEQIFEHGQLAIFENQLRGKFYFYIDLEYSSGRKERYNWKDGEIELDSGFYNQYNWPRIKKQIETAKQNNPDVLHLFGVKFYRDNEFKE